MHNKQSYVLFIVITIVPSPERCCHELQKAQMPWHVVHVYLTAYGTVMHAQMGS